MEPRVGATVPLEEELDRVLAEGVLDSTRLGEIARLGAQLIIQRRLEEEVSAFLDRARDERKVEGRGSRNGYRTRRLQTAEGELDVAMPQLRDTAEHFVSKVIPDRSLPNTVLRSVAANGR